jgi:hypothetical protein
MHSNYSQYLFSFEKQYRYYTLLYCLNITHALLIYISLHRTLFL